MGNMFSFFTKPKGTKKQLEDLENEIDQIEEYRISAMVRERNCNALLILTSVIFYIIGIGYLYFDYNHSKSYVYKTVALFFLLAVPLILYYARSLVAIYYKWVKETNDMKRIALLKLKKKILSKVQETETFNDAKQILERFDPGALRNMSMSLTNLSNLDARGSPSGYRPPISRPSPTAPQSRIMSPPARPPGPLLNQGGNVPNNSLVSFNANYAATPRQALSRTVKPILPQNRSVVEKVVDYIFADGPSNRYALVCVRCYAHNGMALPDEFEYISYICAYCGTFNPARKMRPNAPKVDFNATHGAPKAIEAPKVEEADEDSASSVKITELSSELNKTMEVQVVEANDSEQANDESTMTSPPKAGKSTSDSIPFADADESETGNSNDNPTSTT